MVSGDGQSEPGPPPRRQKAARPSLPQNIGGFFGHIIKAINTDVTAPKPTTIRVTRDEQPIDTPIGPGTLRTTVRDELQTDPRNPQAITARRITTEEVQVRPPTSSPPPPPPA
jgi:hypothetical protein